SSTTHSHTLPSRSPLDATMDDDELPRISIPSMRVWLGIKAKYTRDLEAIVENLMQGRNFTPQQKEALLARAHENVESVFKIAQANIRINGRDFVTLQPHEQDAEPFDEALDRKIWTLAGSRLEWHQKIAKQRRETPLTLANALQEQIKEREQLDQEFDAEDPLQDMDVDEPSEGPKLEVDETVLGRILAVTGELDQIIPLQRERSERSRTVEAEIKALRP
ncbi:unnamed protein product, partial [Mycena citricolor]